MKVNWRFIFENSSFWAVQVAKKAIERAKSKGKNFVMCRCASTPTGVIHIGNANEAIRNYFVAESVKMLGFDARIVFTSDDRDPMRGFPHVVCDKHGNLMEFGQKEEFERKYEGQPVCFIPDPFKCHSSWAEHFVSVFFKELAQLGIEVEYYSPNILYFQGEWDWYVERALEERERVKEIYRNFKQHMREFAFSPICKNCGRIGTTIVLDYDRERRVVKYICGGRHLKKKAVEGCGHEGEASIREGKLDWYIEWAVDWHYFDADVEPLGKDHYESSFRISPHFVRELFGGEPPIMVVYEFFTVNGQKMSGSKGNLYNLSELLKFLPPEVILFFYSKKPLSERDINLSRVNLLVDEFDALEERVWKTVRGLESGGLEERKLRDEKFLRENGYATPEEMVIYYLCTRGRIRKPCKVSYNFCAVISQITQDRNAIKEILLKTGHISGETGEEELERIYERIKLAGYWAKKHAPDFLRIEVRFNPVELSEEEKKVLRELAAELESESEFSPERVQRIVYGYARKTEPKRFFKNLYLIFLGKEKGPRIGSLFAAIGKERVTEFLKRACE